MKSNLHKTIMRRVYYSYTLSFLAEPMLWQGAALGAFTALFGRLTHVAAILHNFTSTKVEQTPMYIWNSFVYAFQNGESLTVLITLFMIGLSVKFCYRAAQLLAGAKKWQPI